MFDWRTWLTIALVGAPCLGYVALLLAEAQGRRETGRSPLAAARAWLLRPFRSDPYPPEAAEAPDDVMAVADAVAEDDTVEIQRAQPWTGDNVTAPAPSIVAGDDITTYQASKQIDEICAKARAAYELYRDRGLRQFGGAPELGPGARWTKRGWKTDRRVR